MICVNLLTCYIALVWHCLRDHHHETSIKFKTIIGAILPTTLGCDACTCLDEGESRCGTRCVIVFQGMHKNQVENYTMKCSKTDIHIPSLHSVSCVATADGEGSESSATLAISYEQREGNNHNMYYTLSHVHRHKKQVCTYIPVRFFLRTHCTYPSVA